jgi:tetratricopeptide (TPR) repeat protein
LILIINDRKFFSLHFRWPKGKIRKKFSKNSSVKPRSGNFNLILVLAGIAAGAFLIYSNIFDNSTHFDDAFIFDNPLFHDLANIGEIASINIFRFFSFMSFALNYSYSGAELGSYFVVNVIIHALNSFLVFLLAGIIFRTPAIREMEIAKHSKWIALGAALIFLAHPLQTQAVTYIYQRLASLVSLFYLSTVFFFIKGRLSGAKNTRTAYFIATGLSFVIALFTKENSFTLPFALIVTEIMLFNKELKIKTKYFVFAGLALVMGFALFFAFLDPAKVFGVLENYNDERITSFNYLLTQFKVIPRYFFLMLFPVNQNFDHHIPAANSFADIEVIGGFIVTAGVLIFGLLFAKRNRLVSFGIIWIYITLAIESSIIPIMDVMFEHRLYLPMFGFAFILPVLAYKIAGAKNLKKAAYAIGAIAVIFAFAAHLRNNTWQNEMTLWNDVIDKSPEKARGWFKRGQTFMNEGNEEKALEDFEKAIEIEPDFRSAYTYKGLIHFENGDFNKAINEYSRYINRQPDRPLGYLNRAQIYIKTGNPERALSDYNTYLMRMPQDSVVIKERAEFLMKLGRPEEAEKDLLKLTEPGEADFEIWKKLSQAYFKNENSRKAIDAAQMALQFGASGTEKSDLNNTVGNIFYSEGKKDSALKYFQAAAGLSTNNLTALRNMTLLQKELGRYNEAIASIDRIIKMNPRDPQAYVEKAKIYLEMGEKEKALTHLRRALELNPEHAEAKRLAAGI